VRREVKGRRERLQALSASSLEFMDFEKLQLMEGDGGGGTVWGKETLERRREAGKLRGGIHSREG